MRTVTSLLPFLCLLTSCMQTLQKDEKVSVRHYPVIRNNEVDNPVLWLQVQFSHESGTNQWTEIPIQAISGFDFELGYDYELEIRKEEVIEPSKSAYLEYTLLDVIKKEKVSTATTFDLPIKSKAFNPSQLVQGNASAGYSLINDIAIECTTLCETMEQRIANNSEVTGVFRHNYNGTIKLVNFR